MEFNPGLTVGIDLGTTFSTIAHLDESGNPVALLNDEGKDETPSLILLAESGHVIVGPNRMRAAMEDPQNVVERIKRHMGRADFKRTFDGREITPEFLSALILKKLRQDAEKQVGPVGNAVITVPYYFNDLNRKATQDAGLIAGLNVIDIINEPTAATLTYAWKRGELGVIGGGEKSRLVLIYDLGGGTFDVTVVRYTPSHFQVLATDGDVELGGVDWNDRLMEHVAQLFKEKFGADVRESPATLQMLLFDCDQAKVALTEKAETTIPCRHEGKSLNVPITREQFESLTADLLQRTVDTSELVLDQAGIRAQDLDALVMVGGSTLMPAVRKRVHEALGIEPYAGISPFTSVAQGAAIHAAILEAKYRGGGQSDQADKLRKMLAAVKQENVNSHGLGVMVRNPKNNKQRNYVMIHRNSRLPVEVRQTFVTTTPDQRRVNVQVLQGEAPDPAACAQIGNCRITGLPEGLPKGSPVEVVYAFDESGRIHVRAEDKVGGRVASTEIERPGGMDQAKIDLLARLASDYHVE